MRETDAALSLIRGKLSANPKLDLAWVERLLRDAALKDFAGLFENFLNEELSQLIGPPQLRHGEQFHSYQHRTVCSIFGNLSLRRAYYTGPDGGRFPLDEALGLHDRYTPAVVQLMCWAGAMDSSFDLAGETLLRFAGLSIPGRQVQRVVNNMGKNAANWMQNRPADKLSAPVEILNIQADMTGIPMRPEELTGIKGKQPDGSAKTRQIKIGCVFTQTVDQKEEPQRDPFSSTYLSAFCAVSDFGTMLRSEALKRGYAAAKKTVFIGDGAEWIWNMVNDCFKDAVQIVDFYHACEHLHTVCEILETDEIRIKSLFKKWRKRLKNNGLLRILIEAAERATYLDPSARGKIEAELAYFRKNAHRMTYKTFRSKGYFIGSGPVEGSCRHIVAQRTKLSGMRWLCCGAENVLSFRSLIKSNLFNAYCSAQKVA